MATRYSHKVKIVCRLVAAPHMPHGEQYKCSISVGGVKRATEYVGLPRVLTHSIDSPRAFDDAAAAALSFALHENKLDESDCDLSLGDISIARRASTPRAYSKRKRAYGRR